VEVATVVPPVRRPAPCRSALLVAVALLPLAACADLPNFGAPEPVTRQGRDVLHLWKGSVVAAAAVGLLVWGLIVWALLRYRRRHDDLPSQSPYNVPVEIVYTAVPLVIVAVLFGFTVATQVEVLEKAPRPDVEVDVVGFQWQWQFRYRQEGVVVTGTVDEPPVLVLPVGAVVRLHLESADVNHSFWVPEFLSKRDLIRGVENAVDVEVTEEGRWRGRCAEFCGLDHWRMVFDVAAVPPPAFDEWMQDQQDQQQPSPPGTEQGPRQV
jgi:cytochrome c oxidase subunit II